MESGIPNEQRIIQTRINILLIMQLARNISKNDEQYISRNFTQRSVCKLYK